MFDTKIAYILRDDLPTWQRLNVVAFLATGIASAAPEIMGQPYIDSLGRTYGNMSGQPMLIFEANLDKLKTVHRKALERGVTLIPYIHAMFSTGHDEANREVFRAADGDNLDLVGIGLRGPKKEVDKVIKGIALHK
ncbi:MULTISPECIES: DUF2000 domain-containing protein [Enterobacteriaceae]|uniref:DUF2000 domain-containing protein n=1 Tax=Raoultella lignicola TaxID=3040939 RepID=A0ABU9F9V7_9ENTR|nr:MULTISPECIES: DUF2000 domain-containing protein [Enterobacteriaceae]MRT48497.1 DUF2000 family protein [Raoultella sp. RIT712]QNK09174.1 DUF2000 domain-containing protein [Enterobacter sp. JUb54]ROS15576.1 hypothetical protein EDF82_0672 [Raoultella sp. BIGb0399]